MQLMRTVSCCLGILVASALVGCSSGAQSVARGVDPSDVSAITSRLGTILPKGWRIVRTDRDTYPSYRPPGKGIGVFLAPPELRQRKTEYEAAVYVMPPDYQDGGDDLTGGAAQSWPARLVAATDRMKIYVWGGWNGAQDLSTEEQVRNALLK